MRVITSRFWKVCEADHCILLTNKKAAGDIYGYYADFYLCHEHCTEDRMSELEARFLQGKL